MYRSLGLGTARGRKRDLIQTKCVDRPHAKGRCTFTKEHSAEVSRNFWDPLAPVCDTSSEMSPAGHSKRSLEHVTIHDHSVVAFTMITEL